MTFQIVRQNFSEKIAEIIRGTILNLEIEPGSRLMLVDYANTFGVSRTPIREALKQLSKEGLVVYDGKSYYVKKHTLEEIKDLFVVRRSLELTSVEQAVMHRTDTNIKQMEDLCLEGEFFVQQGNLDAFINYDKSFHNMIAISSQNIRIQTLMAQFTDECWWINKYIFLNNPVKYSLEQTFQAHREIVNFIKKQDVDNAVEGMRKHILEGEARKFQALQDIRKA